MFNLDTNDTLRIVQISDTHLSSAQDGHLLGMNTLHSLNCVLDLIQQSDRTPDILLVTGDLSQDGSLESYQHLKLSLARFDCPIFWMAGNHDEPGNMMDVIGDGHEREQLIRTSHWQLVLLNSQVPGCVHGELAESQLALLQDSLESASERHTLISFHHHPVCVSSKWMEGIGLQNSDQLFKRIKGNRSVKALLWGHVHQAFDDECDGLRLLSTPSTCVQFAPGSDEFSIDCKAPGYRWLDLHPDGRIETGVERASHIEFEVDYSVKGY